MRSVLLRGFALFISLYLVGCDILPTTGQEEEEEQEQVYGKIGCYAAAYGQAAGTLGRSLGTTLGNQAYDQRMNQEVTLQRGFFSGIPAAVYILNEGGPQYKNAYATPDGYILFGYHMFYYTIGTFGELAAAGVLAHEWGHRTQFVHGWPTANPTMELEADAFSGYYMALAKQWAWSQIRSYYASVYTSGDYNFHHSSHHGTPDQRVAAAYMGVQTALQTMQQNRPLTYQELHEVFSTTIREQIAPNAGKQTRDRADLSMTVRNTLRHLGRTDFPAIARGEHDGEEVEYPRRLSKTDLLRLRPRPSN